MKYDSFRKHVQRNHERDLNIIDDSVDWDNIDEPIETDEIIDPTNHLSSLARPR